MRPPYRASRLRSSPGRSRSRFRCTPFFGTSLHPGDDRIRHVPPKALRRHPGPKRALRDERTHLDVGRRRGAVDDRVALCLGGSGGGHKRYDRLLLKLADGEEDFFVSGPKLPSSEFATTELSPALEVAYLPP